MSLQELGRTLVAFGVLAVLTGTAASAQNLDQGKSAAKLFTDSCATCHRSPRGLAKGRFNFTLSMFLREHYATSSDSASALASYLQSVDSNQGGPSRTAAKSSRRATRTPRSSLRPPAPVPGR
jgi:mono/diheme cytochrome c family protein